jgi:hypothetical protein
MSRQKDDFYPTPDTAIRPLLNREAFLGEVWEPACGDGAISKVLQEHGYKTISTDLNDWGYGESRRDFLMEVVAPTHNIVTNPPYKLAQEFIQHAIDLEVYKHCWLLRLSFLEGVKRFNELFAKNQPSRIYVFSKRVTMWRGDEEPRGTGTTCYAWFVWEGRSFSTEVDWI